VTEPAAEAIPRLEAAFKHALAKAAPGAVVDATTPPFAFKYRTEDEFQLVGNGGDRDVTIPMYDGFGHVHWHGRSNKVNVAIGWGHRVDLRCPTGWHDCRQYSTASGQRVTSLMFGYEEHELGGHPGDSVEQRLTDEGYVDTTVSYHVWVDRGDGSYVFVGAYPGAPDDSVPSRIPTLDRAVLEKIALDPGLTVHP
jgi:hypothetical protein